MASSTGSPASRRFAKLTPLTTRPASTSRHGMTRVATLTREGYRSRVGRMSGGREMDGNDPVDRIVRLVAASRPRCGGTRLVAVDGPSGAGKTTLAAEVADALGAPTIHMDDLYPGWDGLAASTERVREWVVD